MNEFDLCQFGFVDVDLLRLLLTAQRIGSQTTTCRNKKANCNTRTSTGTGSKTFFFFFLKQVFGLSSIRVFTFGVLSTFRCCPDNERKGKIIQSQTRYHDLAEKQRLRQL